MEPNRFLLVATAAAAAAFQSMDAPMQSRGRGRGRGREVEKERERSVVYRTRPHSIAHSRSFTIPRASPTGVPRYRYRYCPTRPIVPVCTEGSLPRRVPFGYKLLSRSRTLDGNVIEREKEREGEEAEREI